MLLLCVLYVVLSTDVATPSGLATSRTGTYLLAQTPTLRGRLGLELASEPLTAADGEGLGLKNPRGAFVMAVQPGGPAEAAGVRAEDVIVQFDGADISASSELASRIAGSAPGTTVKITLIRQGKSLVLEAVVGPPAAAPVAGSTPGNARKVLPAPEAESRQQIGLGLRLATVERNQNIPSNGGALIGGVVFGGVADRAGLLQGDVILKINGQEVQNPQDAQTLLDKVPAGGRIRIFFWRPTPTGGQQRAVIVTRP